MSTRTASPFLHPTSKVFYRRITIPRKIRQHFKGRVELWRSLKTIDPDQASVRSARFDAETKRLFVTLKKHGDRLTKEQVEVLVNRWLETELDELEDYMAVSGPFSDTDRDTKSIVLSDLWQEANEALISCDFRKVEREAESSRGGGWEGGLLRDTTRPSAGLDRPRHFEEKRASRREDLQIQLGVSPVNCVMLLV